MMGQGDISGVWFNPKTGQKVTARQMISDGNETFVQTDQGMITMDVFSNFVQMGNDTFDMDGNKTGTSVESIENIFATYDQEKPDESLLNKPLKSNKDKSDNAKTKENSTIEISTKIEEKSVNEEILDRAFSKIEGTPRIINIEIDWDGLPLDKIKSMIELMDLSVADVSKYILKKYFKTTNIIENKITKELI